MEGTVPLKAAEAALQKSNAAFHYGPHGSVCSVVPAFCSVSGRMAWDRSQEPWFQGVAAVTCTSIKMVSNQMRMVELVKHESCYIHLLHRGCNKIMYRLST